MRLPEPEPEIDPQLFVDAELAAKRPRERQKRSSFAFVQAGKLQRQAEVQRLRVRLACLLVCPTMPARHCRGFERVKIRHRLSRRSLRGLLAFWLPRGLLAFWLPK